MRRMILNLLVCLVWLLPIAKPAGADPVVVELFTSQGCSSCPAADVLLAELAAKPDIVPLALHVDYWDYIGWKDQFARPAHALWQRRYVARAGKRTLYTPQMIIDGREQVVGARPVELARAILNQMDHPKPVVVSLERRANALRIRAEVRGNPPAGTADIRLIQYIPSATVNILRGENAGRELTYHNIVTDQALLDNWDLTGVWSGDVEVKSDRYIAVVIQQKNAGPVLGAAKLE